MNNTLYRHQYFTLNKIAKKVFDENGKELTLTGNAYRLLEFLCERKHAKLLEIGEFLDRAKEYSEDHLRQYRYKIDTIIGHKIVEYKNNVYSIIGEVTESDRNTALLHQNLLQLPHMEKIGFMKWPAVSASILLLLTFFDLPYGYYILLRWIVAGASAYYAYYIYLNTKKPNFLLWILVFNAILFNPIVPIHLGDKSIWWIIDIIAAILLMFTVLKIKPKE